MAAATHKKGTRITFPRRKDEVTEVKRGHFAVYTTADHDDGRSRRRFVIPLEFLNHTIFRELLRLSEEQLGLPSDGPITLPCHPSFLEYLIGLFQSHRSIPEDMVKALLMSISAERNSSCWQSCGLEQTHQPFVIYGF
ncbi:unnamed protein product [Linum trigynum]